MDNKLRELRQMKKLSQEGLGELLGVSRQTVNSIETGRYNPSIQLAFKAAKIFNLTIEDIFIYHEGEDND